MSTTIATSHEELIQLSAKLWDMWRYYSNVSGPPNLEMSESSSTLLYNIATELDRALVCSLPKEAPIPTPQLRRAKAYVSQSKAGLQRA